MRDVPEGVRLNEADVGRVVERIAARSHAAGSHREGDDVSRRVALVRGQALEVELDAPGLGPEAVRCGRRRGRVVERGHQRDFDVVARVVPDVIRALDAIEQVGIQAGAGPDVPGVPDGLLSRSIVYL